MPIKFPTLEPPVISAYLVGIQLLNEHVELFANTVDAIRTKSSTVDAKLEQAWSLQAGLAEFEGEKKPKLVVEVSLSVDLIDPKTDAKIAKFTNRSRAVFEIVGVLGEITGSELPAKSIEPHLITVADRVRGRCHASFRAMNLPVTVPSPRDFGRAPSPTQPVEKERLVAAKSPLRKKKVMA